MTQEQTYGFFDENNILIETAVILENDVETLKFLCEKYNAVAHYISEEKIPLISRNFSQWQDGELRVPPYPNWIWNTENQDWESPVPMPETPEGKTPVWSVEQNDWILIEKV
jgi:hypothetical protein